MSKNAVIAGVGMIPFTKPGRNEGYEVMGEKATRAALSDAGIDYDQIQQAYAGYVYGDSCSGQAALYRVGINGVPIVNVNNNCASGTTAFALAVQAVESGAMDCVLALGFEEMEPGALAGAFPNKTLPVERHLKAIIDLLSLGEEVRQVPPAVLMFACQIAELQRQYGISEEALARIAVKARKHAEHNPYAIFRNPLTVEEILAGEPVYKSMRKLFACPPSCGAAAVIVCSEKFALQHGIRSDVRLIGKGWCSDQAEYLESNVLDVMFRGVSKAAANMAYESAGLGPNDIDVIELHDCFVSNEIITYGALGLCKEDDLESFVMSDQNTYGGKVVVNPSGGLISKGHPLGATGLAQITELTWQLRGDAGVRQVNGARTALQHNGGLGSAGFVHIFQKTN